MPGHRALRIAVAIAALAAASCATARLAAPPIDARACTIDPALTGRWTDSRLSSLGPAWSAFTLRCDCTYDARVQLLWMRISEHGQYVVGDGTIFFERPGGRTAWPYSLGGDRMELTEAPNERHTYSRSDKLVCPSPR